MNIGILTCEGFNEIDSFVAFSMLNRLKHIESVPADLSIHLVALTTTVTSSNGIAIEIKQPLSYLSDCDAVLIGSGVQTDDYVTQQSFLERFQLDPTHQFIGSQCSGALILDALRLLDREMPISTDYTTQSKMHDKGYVISEHPFSQQGNIATAGGCLASEYLACWVAYHLYGKKAATEMLRQVVPVGSEAERIQHVFHMLGI